MCKPSLQDQLTNGWCGETVFSSRRNADCRLLVSMNWHGLTTSEPGSRQSGINWRQRGIWFHHHCHLASRFKPPNIWTFDQRLIKAPEEVADCGRRWISLMRIKCKKKWKQGSDVTLWCRARANDPSVLLLHNVHIQIFNPCQLSGVQHRYLHSYLTKPNNRMYNNTCPSF